MTFYIRDQVGSSGMSFNWKRREFLISVFSFNTIPGEAKRNILHHFQGFWKYSLNLIGSALHYSPKIPACVTVVRIPVSWAFFWCTSVISPSHRDFTSNKFICVFPVFALQFSTPVDEVTRIIIHLLRQVIKRCHSPPKLGLIVLALQAVFPASCSSPLTDQDIHPKERHIYCSDCNSLHYTVKSAPPYCFFFQMKKKSIFPSHGVLIFRYSM